MTVSGEFNCADYYKSLMDQGYEHVCGLDGVGLGALFGPICVGSIIVPLPQMIEGARDSKDMTDRQRDKLTEVIKKEVLGWNLTWLTVQDYDDIGPRKCEIRGLARLIKKTRDLFPDLVDSTKFVIDGNYKLSEIMLELGSSFLRPSQLEIKEKGDSLINAISAASILAKTARDDLIVTLAKEYPYYQLESNKGYYAAVHVEGISKIGYTVHHRKCSHKFGNKAIA